MKHKREEFIKNIEKMKKTKKKKRLYDGASAMLLLLCITSSLDLSTRV